MNQSGPAQAHDGLSTPAPPRRSRWGWGCLIALLLVVTGMVLLMGLASTLAAFGSGDLFADMSGNRIVEEVIRPADTAKKIAVIDIRGVILSEQGAGAPGSRRICFELSTAREDPDVVAILLDMDTPGGEVTASDEIHDEVRRCIREGKPVVTCMRGVAASGGYYIAAGSDWIVANRLSITGSIGVLIGTTNYRALFEKIGLEAEVYKSGPMKDMLRGSRERTEAERVYVQTLVDHAYRAFAAVVAAGRQSFATAEEVMQAECGDGRVLTGTDAFRLGLVDQLGYFDDALAKALELAQVPQAQVVRYGRPWRFTDLFATLQARTAGGLGGLLPPEMQALSPGRIYFLMPEAVP